MLDNAIEIMVSMYFQMWYPALSSTEVFSRPLWLIFKKEKNFQKFALRHGIACTGPINNLHADNYFITLLL